MEAPCILYIPLLLYLLYIAYLPYLLYLLFTLFTLFTFYGHIQIITAAIILPATVYPPFIKCRPVGLFS